MKVLLDSNVALDAMLDRPPFNAAAAKLLSVAGEGVEFFISASAVTDVFYITRRTIKNNDFAMSLLNDLLDTVSVATVGEHEIRRAISLGWNDFEDAVQYCAGERLFLDRIVSRDKDGYKSGAMPVCTPDELLLEISK